MIRVPYTLGTDVSEVVSYSKTMVTTTNKKKVKVIFSLYRPGVAQRVGRGIALLFHDGDTRRG